MVTQLYIVNAETDIEENWMEEQVLLMQENFRDNEVEEPEWFQTPHHIGGFPLKGEFQSLSGRLSETIRFYDIILP